MPHASGPAEPSATNQFLFSLPAHNAESDGSYSYGRNRHLQLQLQLSWSFVRASRRIPPPACPTPMGGRYPTSVEPGGQATSSFPVSMGARPPLSQLLTTV